MRKPESKAPQPQDRAGRDHEHQDGAARSVRHERRILTEQPGRLRLGRRRRVRSQPRFLLAFAARRFPHGTSISAIAPWSVPAHSVLAVAERTASWRLGEFYSQPTVGWGSCLKSGISLRQQRTRGRADSEYQEEREEDRVARSEVGEEHEQASCCRLCTPRRIGVDAHRKRASKQNFKSCVRATQL